MRPVRTAARAMLASIFVVDGVRHLINPEAKVETARRVLDKVGPMLEKADPRIPTDPRTIVRAKAATDVVAGLALATGHLTRPAAAVLAVGLLPVAATDRGDMPTSLLKNLGLLGGLLLAAADTEGRPSLHYRTTHAVDRSQRAVKRAAKAAKRDAKIAAMSATMARKLPG
ncbi:DoxX family membrane protein [Actinoplanes sp. KI2]|uniref:DoxX family protein n=1 Tax=Actinoplanes sp. KI2 TaxID=2983315 RepID=UPI0021D580FD|nr:DoxX family membrane protein [Actinoplanes sp. KI2]MCU7722126.1 DoxX family membrane protein [Actinoplanes sp. KI2]